MVKDKQQRVPIPRSLWYSIIMSYLCGIAITTGALVYMKHVDNESNRKWCDIAITLDEGYKKIPPQSEVGRRIAADMHKLRNDFEC